MSTVTIHCTVTVHALIHCWSTELTGPTGLGSGPGSPGGPTYKLETQ